MNDTPSGRPSTTDLIHLALAADDGEAITRLLDSMPSREALRELLALGPNQRGHVLELVSPELAGELIEKAPIEIAVDLVERLGPDRAAVILEELDSDVQADVIGELDAADAEAILAEMEPEDAADVRRLAEYEDDTAGGLMVAEAFTFGSGDTVGLVLRRLATDEEDFERYRGQHPYVIDADARPIGVVSLRSLLTARRSARLTEIMVKPLTVLDSATLDELEDIFDEHPFLGLPVVKADGQLVGVVSRSAVDNALLDRAADAVTRRRQPRSGPAPSFVRSTSSPAWNVSSPSWTRSTGRISGAPPHRRRARPFRRSRPPSAIS